MKTKCIMFPEWLRVKCLSLIQLGSLMVLFNITHYMQIISVNDALEENELHLHHLTDLSRLCNVLLQHDELSDKLLEDINEVNNALMVSINITASIPKPCSRNTTNLGF